MYDITNNIERSPWDEKHNYLTAMLIDNVALSHFYHDPYGLLELDNDIGLGKWRLHFYKKRGLIGKKTFPSSLLISQIVLVP